MALTMKRKRGESIQIGTGIKLTVKEVCAGSVYITIDAPRNVAILRSELLPWVSAPPAVVASGESR